MYKLLLVHVLLNKIFLMLQKNMFLLINMVGRYLLQFTKYIDDMMIKRYVTKLTCVYMNYNLFHIYIVLICNQSL